MRKRKRNSNRFDEYQNRDRRRIPHSCLVFTIMVVSLALFERKLNGAIRVTGERLKCV